MARVTGDGSMSNVGIQKADPVETRIQSKKPIDGTVGDNSSQKPWPGNPASSADSSFTLASSNPPAGKAPTLMQGILQRAEGDKAAQRLEYAHLAFDPTRPTALAVLTDTEKTTREEASLWTSPSYPGEKIRTQTEQDTAVDQVRKHLDSAKAQAKSWSLGDVFRDFGASLAEISSIQSELKRVLDGKILPRFDMQLSVRPEDALPSASREALENVAKNIENLRNGRPLEKSDLSEAAPFYEGAQKILQMWAGKEDGGKLAAEQYLASAILTGRGINFLSQDLVAAKTFPALATRVLTQAIQANADVLNGGRDKPRNSSPRYPEFQFHLYLDSAASGDAKQSLWALAVLKTLNAPGVDELGKNYLDALRGAMDHAGRTHSYFGRPASDPKWLGTPSTP